MNSRRAGTFDAFKKTKGAAIERDFSRQPVADRAARTEPAPKPSPGPKPPFEERVAGALLDHARTHQRHRSEIDALKAENSRLVERLDRLERINDERARADHAVATLKASRE